MNDFDKPLKTLEDARRLFQAMGCSRLHLERERPERYTEYRLLGVSESVERVWRREQIASQAAKLADEGCDPKDYWAIHSRLVALVSDQKEPEPLFKTHELTAAIAAKALNDDALALAETVLGVGPRETRPGLVYLAFDLGRADLAASFADIALALCARSQGSGEKRTRDALSLCTTLKTELGL